MGQRIEERGQDVTARRVSVNKISQVLPIDANEDGAFLSLAV